MSRGEWGGHVIAVLSGTQSHGAWLTVYSPETAEDENASLRQHLEDSNDISISIFRRRMNVKYTEAFVC